MTQRINVARSTVGTRAMRLFGLLPLIILGLASTFFGLASTPRTDPHQQKSQPGAERFLAVKKWHLVMTWSAASRHNEIKQGDRTDTYDLTNYSGSLTCTLEDENPPLAEPPYGEWRTEKGNGDVIQRYKQVIREKPPEGKESNFTMEFFNSGFASGMADLNIDIKEKTYRISGSVSTDTGGVKTTIDGAASTSNNGLVLGYPSADVQAQKVCPLPKNGLNLSGGDVFHLAVGQFNGAGPGLEVITVNVTWELSPEGQEDGDLFIENLDKWIPEPDKPARISIKCDKGVLSEVKVTLYEVSRLKGENGNKGDDTDPDLSFDPDSGYKIVDEGGGEWSATNQNNAYDDRTAIDIIAHDSAARGKVRVEGKVNGKWIKAKRRGGGDHLDLPLDENKNMIADQWEIDEGIKSKNLPPDWDGETAMDNPNKGDGISLFDEYRGLETRSGFKRLSPQKQDLCVANSLGDQVKDGFALFTKIVGVDVVDLKGDAITRGDHRLIKNKTNYSTDQEAVILDAEGGGGGITNAKNGSDITKTPKEVDQCLVGTDLLKGTPNTPAGRTKARLDAAVAHELGHAIGLPHHGTHEAINHGHLIKTTEAYLHVLAQVNGVFLDLREYTESGTRRPRPVDYKIDASDLIGLQSGQSSGDWNCLMCYQDLYQWCWVIGGGQETFYKVPDTPPHPTRLCNSKAGTEINADHKFFSDGLRGDCAHKFKVKD